MWAFDYYFYNATKLIFSLSISRSVHDEIVYNVSFQNWMNLIDF